MEGGGSSSDDGKDIRSSSDWAELTRECLTDILSRLSLEDRWKSVMFVCKSWLQACKDPSLFSIFDLEIHFKSGAESPLWWSSEFERKIDLMLRSVVSWSSDGLKVIRVRRCSDRSLDFVAERCPKLQILSIKSCPNVTDASIAKIASGCPMLTEIDISYCYKVSHESLQLIGKNCLNLRILKRNFMNCSDRSKHVGIVPEEYLNACPQDGDSEAAAIGEFMPLLEQLELRFSKLSVTGLASISKGCLNLESLDLLGCGNIKIRDIAGALGKHKRLKRLVRPYSPRSIFHTDRFGAFGHWRLCDERFMTDVSRT